MSAPKVKSNEELRREAQRKTDEFIRRGQQERKENYEKLDKYVKTIFKKGK